MLQSLYSNPSSLSKSEARQEGQRLCVTHLRLSYPLPGNRFLPVLHIPSWCVAPSTVVAITGPSGSGKTSLLHLLCGLEKPESGSIQWNGIDITQCPESARDRWRRHTVGLIFQDFHLFPGMSALQNVLVPASFEYFRIPTNLKQRAHDLLHRVGLTQVHEPVEKLSRGEMQRVAVARALLFAPPILLADEPVASLDLMNGILVMDTLRQIASEVGLTVIAILHHVEYALRYADRILGFRAGRLVFDGPPLKLTEAVMLEIFGELPVSFEDRKTLMGRPS